MKRLLLPFLVLAAALPAPADAAYGPTGTLNQLPGADGCLHETAAEPCADARGLGGIGRLGHDRERSIFVVPAAATDSVALLQRDQATGVLSQAGCVAPAGSALDCGRGRNLAGAAGAAISPDGRDAYVAGANGIAVLRHDATSGPTFSGCLSDDGVAQPGSEEDACANGRALSGLTAIAMSRAGDFVYAAADPPGTSSDGVVVLARDATTGALTQAGCVTAGRTASGDGDTGPAAGCAGPLRAAEGPSDLVVSPDGTVYVATRAGVIALVPQPGGLLRQPDADVACHVSLPQDGCVDARGLGEPHSLALSPDGVSLYVSNRGVAEVAHFYTRIDDQLLLLLQPTGSDGCIAARGAASDGPGPCAVLRSPAGDGPGIGVAPDGATVAVGSGDSEGAVALLDRAPGGALSQPSDFRGCVSHDGAGTCAVGKGVGGADFAWSPGAHHFYAAGGPSIGFLRREVAPTCSGGASATTDNISPVTLTFPCTDVNGDGVTLEVAFRTATGNPEPAGGLQVRYTPAVSSSGRDAFSVRPRDSSGNTGPEVVGTVDISFRLVHGFPPTRSHPVPLPSVSPQRLRVRNGRLALRLACPAGAVIRCRGRLTMTTASVRLTRGGKARRLRVGSLRYDIAPGRTRRFSVRAPAAVRRLVRLRRSTRLSLALAAPAQDPRPAAARTLRGTLVP